MPSTPKVNESAKEEVKPSNDKVELAFDPQKEIKQWDKMPEHIRRFKMEQIGLNIDGTPIVSPLANQDTEGDLQIEGIARKLTLEKAIELRNALNKAIEEYEEI